MTTHTKDQLRKDLPLLNRTVAELMGWKEISFNEWFNGPRNGKHVLDESDFPDFTGSLDACRLFWKGLTQDERREFSALLYSALTGIEIEDIFAWRLNAATAIMLLDASPVDHCIAFACLRGVCE